MSFWNEYLLAIHRALFFPVYWYFGLEATPIEEELWLKSTENAPTDTKTPATASSVGEKSSDDGRRKPTFWKRDGGP